jgi:hypothetical protein
MAAKHGGSKSVTRKGKTSSTSNKLVFHISVMEDGEIVIDESFGNLYSNRGGKKVEWTITGGFEFKLDFNLIPYAGLDGTTVWPFDRPGAVNGNSTGWLDSFKGDPGAPGVYKYDLWVRREGTYELVGYVDPVIIVGRG